MLKALNSLVVVHKKSTIETVKEITNFFNYSASRPDIVTEYRRSRMVFHVYSDASYISEPEAQSRTDGCFSLAHNTTHQ